MNTRISRTALLLAAAAATPLPASDDRENTTPTAWRVRTGHTWSDVLAQSAAGYRPVDVEIESTSPLRFTMGYVKNSGSYQTGWWMYYGKTSTEIAGLINADRRLVRLRPYVVGSAVRYAAIFVDNTGSNKKPWYYYTQHSLSYIGQRMTANNARIVDFDTFVVGGKRYYSAVAIRNTGADQRSWKLETNLPSSAIGSRASALRMRVTDIEYRGSSRYDVLFTRAPKPMSSWWYAGKTLSEIGELADQNGARIFDIEVYSLNGARRYAALMVQNTNALTTRLGRLMRSSVDGRRGFVLKRLKGATHAGLMRDFVFDPASTLKQLHATFAFHKVLTDQNVKLDTPIPFRDGPCPYTTGNQVQQPLEALVRRVMENSDNRRTDAIERFFGKTAMHSFAKVRLGMANTRSNRVMGCSAPPYNRMTLDDIVSLHEWVAAGNLGGLRDDWIDRWANSRSKFPGIGGRSLPALLTAEAANAGLTSAELASFVSRFRLAYKPGAKTINGKFHRTTSGWVQIPFVVGNVVQPREYVFGAFAHAASNATAASNTVSQIAHELLRDRIRAAISGWKGYRFGDFEKFGTACKAGSRTPNHLATGDPVLGRVASYRLYSGPSGRPAVMWVGASRTKWGSVNLPLSLTALGAPGCRLHVSPDHSIPRPTDTFGQARVDIALVGSTSLIGQRLFTQFGVLAPGANRLGLVTSTAIDTRIGGTK